MEERWSEGISQETVLKSPLSLDGRKKWAKFYLFLFVEAFRASLDVGIGFHTKKYHLSLKDFFS